MAAAINQVSPSVVDAMIRSWKLARLAKDAGKLGYPRINILHPEHGVGEEDDTPDDTDAEIVQRIVEGMPGEIRRVFEAAHLAIINGDSCRGKPHKWRALALGIQQEGIYWARERAGWAIVRGWLAESL